MAKKGFLMISVLIGLFFIIIIISIFVFKYEKEKDYHTKKIISNDVGDYKELKKKILPISLVKKPLKFYNNYNKADKLNPIYFNILLDGEGHYLNNSLQFDFVFSTKKNLSGKNVLYLPCWSTPFIENFDIYDLLHRKFYIKTKFCAFMYTNCDSKFQGVDDRKNLYIELNAIKKVDNLGLCMSKKTAKQVDRYDNDWMQNAIKKYQDYKFVISYENLYVDGYISEKMILPLLAGCIPIYMGDPNVEKVFNKNCFIHARQFSSCKDLVSYILKVDQDETLFQSYIKSPIISEINVIENMQWYFASKGLYSFISLISNQKVYRYEPKFKTFIMNPSQNIIIINLYSSKKRWLSIITDLNKKPYLRYQRFPGLLFNNHDKKHIQLNKIKKLRGFIFREGEIGCYKSHCEIYNQLLMDPVNDYYIILEDDVDISKIKKPIESYIENAPRGWDIIYIGMNKNYCKIKRYKNFDTFDGSKCMPGNFGYIIKKKAAQFIINFSFPIRLPIDEQIREWEYNLNIYIMNPSIVFHKDIESTTIHETEFTK